MNQFVANAGLIATFKRAEIDAARKFGLIKAAEKKDSKQFRRPSKPLQKQQNARIRMQKG